METNSSTTASPDGHTVGTPPTNTTPAEQVPQAGANPGVEGSGAEASEIDVDETLPDGDLQAALEGDAEVHGTAT